MKAINKDILREILKTKSKFLSIVVIMFLGVFIFVGLKEIYCQGGQFVDY